VDKFDYLIIGSGVIGLAIARELSESGKSVLVIERHKTFGQETSSRNSEVIHAGMYYPKGSLKARFCVEGRRLLYDFCTNYNVPFKKTGKIIIALNSKEIPSLESLLALGIDNGVEGLRLIEKKDIKNLEPEVEGVLALYSPETGIVDTHRFMSVLAGLAKEQGAVFAYNCEFLKAEKTCDGFKVSVRNEGENIDLEARVVINAAGLDADIVARNSGFDLNKNNYNLHYCKGQYFRLNGAKAKMLKMLVYPVPQPASGGLGIHVTVDIAGGVRLGPDDEYLSSRVQDYSVNPLSRSKFYESAHSFLPFIKEDDLASDTAGIRPKLQGPGEGFRDFVISEESEKGFPGFINLIGIESPGLTASLAIAERVSKLVSAYS